MSQRLDDTVNTLWQRIMMQLDADDGETCVFYLRNVRQKIYFALERYESLKKNIVDYKWNYEHKKVLNSTYIEMDFDHIIYCLRSSLSYLALLICSVIPLSSYDRLTNKSRMLTLGDVVLQLKSHKQESCVYKLWMYLSENINAEWYKELNEFRIDIFYDRFKNFPRVTTYAFEHQLLDMDCLLSDDAGDSSIYTDKKNILTYSRWLITEVEDIVINSLELLHTCL